MSSSDHAAFLAGDRPDDIAIYLADSIVDDPAELTDLGYRTDEGILLIVEGESGRQVFKQATGLDAMAFARQAMDTDGEIAADLTGGTCPHCGEDALRLLLAFVEEQNEDVGGMYAEGPVIHAYAQCACGLAYSTKWVAGSRQ